MHRSEPAPRRGGMGNYSSYRDSPNRARGPGSGPCSPAKGSPSAGRVEGRRRTGGVQRFRPGSSAPQMQSGRCGAAAPPPRVKNEEDDEGMPKLVGRPEKWSIAQHDLAICQWSGFGWAQCDRCNKWRKPSVAGVDLDVNENDSFVCSDMGDGPGGCPLGCETPEDRSWTSMLAFLGESVQLDEQETLQNGYIENAVNFVVFKAEDAGIFKGNQGAAQKFINDVGCDALADVNELKDLVGRLEAKIKENFKRTDEIREWRSQVAVASTAVEVYRLGWQLEEMIDWPAAFKREQKSTAVKKGDNKANHADDVTKVCGAKRSLPVDDEKPKACGAGLGTAVSAFQAGAMGDDAWQTTSKRSKTGDAWPLDVQPDGVGPRPAFHKLEEATHACDPRNPASQSEGISTGAPELHLLAEAIRLSRRRAQGQAVLEASSDGGCSAAEPLASSPVGNGVCLDLSFADSCLADVDATVQVKSGPEGEAGGHGDSIGQHNGKTQTNTKTQNQIAERGNLATARATSPLLRLQESSVAQQASSCSVDFKVASHLACGEEVKAGPSVMPVGGGRRRKLKTVSSKDAALAASLVGTACGEPAKSLTFASTPSSTEAGGVISGSTTCRDRAERAGALSATATAEELEVRWRYLSKWEQALVARERSLEAREAACAQREEEVASLISTVKRDNKLMSPPPAVHQCMLQHQQPPLSL